MKKTILIATICILSNSAFAGGYAEANKAQLGCKIIGDHAKSTLLDLKKGITPAIPEEVKDDELMKSLLTKIYLDITKGAGVLDVSSAYMIGWSHCMDTIYSN